jgi:DNA processing protein
VPHPRAHLAMYREIVERGLILSELPPGAHAHRGSFPNRNRIIAALARLVIIVEAPMKSGALITCDEALAIGRDVAVVLGPIDSPQSAGSNLLVRDGAHPIIAIEDALTLAGFSAAPRGPEAPVDPIEVQVWNALSNGAASLDDVCVRSGLPTAACLSAVTRLELRGSIECALTGEIRRR